MARRGVEVSRGATQEQVQARGHLRGQRRRSPARRLPIKLCQRAKQAQGAFLQGRHRGLGEDVHTELDIPLRRR